MAFDWKALLGTVAPTIATAFGGPLVGLATKAVIGALRLGPDAKEADIAAAMSNATPADLLALKKADQDFALKMEEIGVDLQRIAAGDRDSARKREVGSRDPWTPRFLGGVIVAGFLTTVFMVLSGEVINLKDPVTASIAGTVIGYVSAKADQVISYYFGSSASSNRKDETIKALAS